MDEHLVPWFFYIDNKNSPINQIPIPTLRVCHKYPTILPRFQVDKGAIPFVLKGSDIFCAGLTSKGGNMVDVEKNAIVAIFAESKQHACSIGITTMSTENMLSECIILVLYLKPKQIIIVTFLCFAKTLKRTTELKRTKGLVLNK